MQGKLDTEALLESKGVNWTSIRPVYIYGETDNANIGSPVFGTTGMMKMFKRDVKPCPLHTGPLNYNPVEEWFFHRIKEGRPIPVPNSGQQVCPICQKM